MAHRIMTLPGALVVLWDDVSPVGRDLDGAHRVIRQHMELLVAELVREQG